MKIKGIHITCQAKVDDKLYATGMFSPANQSFSLRPEDPVFQFIIERLVEDIKIQASRYPDKIGLLISVQIDGRYLTSDSLNTDREPASRDSGISAPERALMDLQGSPVANH